jgi:xylose isomerase
VNAPAHFFAMSAPIAYGGKDASSPFAFRWYDKERVVRGRRLEDHLRFAVCYWHSFCWPGSDPFGGETFLRPWHHGPDPMVLARAKADVAFELFRLLDVPYFTFHDVDAAPEGRSLAESVANLNAIADVFEEKMALARCAFYGVRPTCSRTAATWLEQRPIPIRRSSFTPPGRSERRSRRRIG